MTYPQDRYSSTVDGAAAFERHFGPEREDYDDRPTRAEAEQDEREDRDWLAQHKQHQTPSEREQQ